MSIAEQKLYRHAFSLSLFTIFYNVAEGLIAIYFGYQDETLTLFGFGVDSFIEVLSGIGIAIMIVRIRQNPKSEKSQFEKVALRITGFAFYILSFGLLLGIIFNLINKQRPETTLVGVLVSVLSILVMLWLAHSKNKIGKKLNSEPILADASCTKICIYMSVVLLGSSLIYELTGFVYSDVIGSAGLIYFSFTEGREAFEKAKGKACSCGSCRQI
jgi:divalent metal cation (Fe/Co/Zn/Cd) transporter